MENKHKLRKTQTGKHALVKRSFLLKEVSVKMFVLCSVILVLVRWYYIFNIHVRSVISRCALCWALEVNFVISNIR